MVTVPFPTLDLKATGANIAALRKAKGYSVRDLQAFFGFEQPQAIYKWQWGQSLPSVDNLYALSLLFETPINDILVSTDQSADFFMSVFSAVLASNHQFNDDYLLFRYTTSIPNLQMPYQGGRPYESQRSLSLPK